MTQKETLVKLKEKAVDIFYGARHQSRPAVVYQSGQNTNRENSVTCVEIVSISG